MISVPTVPDSSAVRTALWRALHTEVDALPHVLEDTLGLRLANPMAGAATRICTPEELAVTEPESSRARD